MVSARFSLWTWVAIDGCWTRFGHSFRLKRQIGWVENARPETRGLYSFRHSHVGEHVGR